MEKQLHSFLIVAAFSGVIQVLGMKRNTISPWRKLHISMDPEHNMYGVEVTESIIPDITMMKLLMCGEGIPSVDRVIADGGYYRY